MNPLNKVFLNVTHAFVFLAIGLSIKDNNRQKYPAIPSTSANCERFFRVYGNIISDKGEKMDIELLTLLLFNLNMMLIFSNIMERLCIITPPFMQLNFSNFDSSPKPFNSPLQM